MAVQELFWIPFKKNRKTGEPSTFKTREAFEALLALNYEAVTLEPTDKVRGFAGLLMDAPDGVYAMRGPGFRRYTWEASVEVRQRSDPMFIVT